MEPVYTRIQQIAREIVSCHPEPEFYSVFSSEQKASRRLYKTNDLILALKKEVSITLGNNVGHGIAHVEKVAIDAGTLVMVEKKGFGESIESVERKVVLAQCAGLLHDISRKEKKHAVIGAERAGDILKSYPVSKEEAGSICIAIRNHEAFTRLKEPPTADCGLISDCLYDADKFRWGPDNFSHTIWDMIARENPPLAKFMHLYPKGMAFLKKIKRTFRSKTGKKYGPEFIDIGLSIGSSLFKAINNEFIDPV